MNLCFSKIIQLITCGQNKHIYEITQQKRSKPFDLPDKADNFIKIQTKS